MNTKDVVFTVVDSADVQLNDEPNSSIQKQSQDSNVHCAYVCDEEYE